uniref:PDZ domain-containing protein n=1 Tax=Heterosigma akashiwo TaxID=2829 RepID=A0A7S3XPY1_HETAK
MKNDPKVASNYCGSDHHKNPLSVPRDCISSEAKFEDTGNDEKLTLYIKKTKSLGLKLVESKNSQSFTVYSIDERIASDEVRTKFQIGDQIYSINNHSLTTAADVANVTQGVDVGGTLFFDIERGDKTKRGTIQTTKVIDQQPPQASNLAGSTVQHAYAQTSRVKTYKPNDWMVHSIIATFCCCCPLGMVAWCYSCRVDVAYTSGKYDDAQYNSDCAKTWNAAAMWLGVILWVVASYRLFGVGGLV